MSNENIFKDIMRTEYTISESGIKVPASDFDRRPSYYDKLRTGARTGDEYADMCALKDKSIALYDKRWQSAKAVIDMVAKEVDVNPEATCVYGLSQNGNGEFESPLVDKMRTWFDKSGDKVKLKKRISELEAQIDTLRTLLKG